MTTVESDDVAMEDSGCLGEGAADEDADAPPTEKMPSLFKDDDDPSTGLSWPELVAQLLVDKQVASSLSGHGIHSFHLQRSAAGRGWIMLATSFLPEWCLLCSCSYLYECESASVNEC